MSKKTILVTGSSRGIGRAIALKFAREGWHIFLNCHTSLSELANVQAEILALPGGSCDLLPGDISDPAAVKLLFEQIYQQTPHLDVLVNNAGLAHIGLLSEMTDLEWNRIIQTNLSSVFYCSRAAIPPMVSRKEGRIINISSMWGSSGASCEAAYSAAKAGVHGLTQALAKELAPSNIAVNAIACGVIDTAMNKQFADEEKSQLSEAIPCGRFGTAEEVAQLTWDLANQSNYLTAQVIGLDGGYL